MKSVLLVFTLISWTLIPSWGWCSSDLEGQWVQPCEKGLERTQHFKASHSHLLESFYLDHQCTKPFMQLRTTGQFSTQGAHIDFIFTRVSVRLLDAAQVLKFNTRAVCGFTKWEINKFYDVSGRICDLLLLGHAFEVPPPGEKRFGIFRIQESDLHHSRLLFFGQGNAKLNSTTPEKRPQTYQSQPFFFQNSSE